MRSNYQQFYDQLQEYQLLNHIPNEDALGDKGNLTDHLTARSRTRSIRVLIASTTNANTRLFLRSRPSATVRMSRGF